MAREFGVSQRQMGVVSALTQIGYALGLLLFVPLGDMLEQRRLILVMLGASVADVGGRGDGPQFCLAGRGQSRPGSRDESRLR